MDVAAQPLSTPAKIGIITGILYCVFVFIENRFFYNSPIMFGALKGLFYIIIISAIFYTGFLSKKESGGLITFRDCLKAMLLAIAITELFYLVFNILYLKFIDPAFIEKLKLSYLAFLKQQKLPQEKIDEQMQQFDGAGQITTWGTIQSYGFSIIIDAVFAVIFAAILKKNKPFPENQS